MPTMPDQKTKENIRFVAGFLLFLNIVFGVYVKYVKEEIESVTKLQLDIFMYGAILLGGLSFIMAFVCWFTQSGQKIERIPRYAPVKFPKIGLGTWLFVSSLYYFFLGIAFFVGNLF